MNTLKIEIEKIISQAELNTRPFEGTHKGETVTFTQYFDEYRCEWTNKKRATQGFVFSKISHLIDNCSLITDN